MTRLATVFITLLLLLASPARAENSYTFGVLPQRTPQLTAQYWNPILAYVSSKAGVRLDLVTRKNAVEYSQAEARGEFDFTYNNHIFAPDHEQAHYRVLARPAGEPIHGQIVVAASSPLRTLEDLRGQEVGFPSKAAFVAYAVPMVALAKAGIPVKPVFGGNQEGVMAQLRAGAIQAAAVNARVMAEYAAREQFSYRALWTSEPFLDIPIAAHPRVPPAVVEAVREALVGMAKDPEGLRILEASARLVGMRPPYGFVPARDADYANQREVYRRLWQLEGR
jgi:phosphonate transport system substrate-binding protein